MVRYDAVCYLYDAIHVTRSICDTFGCVNFDKVSTTAIR